MKSQVESLEQIVLKVNSTSDEVHPTMRNLEGKLICLKDTIEQNSLNNQIMVYRLDEDVLIWKTKKTNFLSFIAEKSR